VSDGLLDTSVLIAADPSALELPPTAAISVVTLGELHAGVLLAREAQVRELRRQRLAAVRAAFAPLLVDEPVAERYGELLALARSQGRAAKATDLLIAATAAVHSCTLYTLDRSQAELARAAGIGVATP
jgi:predicted nucleic acid-binding protein